IVLKDRKFTELKEAGEFLRAIIEHTILYEELSIGTYKGLEIALNKNSEGATLYAKGSGLYKVELKKSDSVNIVRLENTINGLDKEAEEIRQKIADYHTEMENAKIEYEKEFQYEDLLKEKLKRQTEINSQLEIKEENEVIDNVPDESVAAPQIAAATR
ncbi:hypothetical protein NSB04_09060, partial [Blautia pseudococcoides]|nr:hypothetical protein [Blautia pseudococcoides]